MAKTNYKEITSYNSPNYTPNAYVPSVYGTSREVIGVVYHWWGDPWSHPLFFNIIRWLCRPNGNSSAHVVGELNRIAWIVDAIHAAWHAGSAYGNAKFVGYECNPRLDSGDYQTMGEFHYDMEKYYGKRLQIRVHKEFSSTSCSPIDKGRIRRIADSLHARDKRPKPKPRPSKPVPLAAKLPKPIRFRTKLAATRVWDLTTNPKYVAVKTLGRHKEFMAYAKIEFNNSVYYVTRYSYNKKLKHGVNSADLERYEQAPPTPEWIRNLKWDKSIGKLSVLPAGGTKVLNLTTTAPVNDEVIPKGTQIDIEGRTTVGGQMYYVSSWARKEGLPWGIPAKTLGKPAVVPPREKPEWLENLQDITDKDFWTRSDAPILSVEDGSTVRIEPINSLVRVTHATEILGKKYMVLQGMTEVVGTIYLSDTPIERPHDDLEKRVKFIEAFITSLVDIFAKAIAQIKDKWEKKP
ncbi:N-acetylmuramoyl-L-alanine amidase domain protein [TM7 phage DolZOral124_53_65]|nr:N-acetylmuramoyl-L-alanine amidase domain protein [TM7 phage DolZOral124_53_65]